MMDLLLILLQLFMKPSTLTMAWLLTLMMVLEITQLELFMQVSTAMMDWLLTLLDKFMLTLMMDLAIILLELSILDPSLTLSTPITMDSFRGMDRRRKASE